MCAMRICQLFVFSWFLFCCQMVGVSHEVDYQQERVLALQEKKHRQHQESYQRELQELLRYCQQEELTEASKIVRQWVQLPDLEDLQSRALPTKVQETIPLDLPQEERFWRTQLRHHRKEYAKQIYLLARQALHAGSPSYAHKLIREVLYFDPDHLVARRLLGYVQYKEDWVTPFAAQMLRKGNVWHDRFGWLPKNHVERYEAGERQFRSRWMSATQEAEIRRDFKYAWEVRTDHFLVKTNHSLEQAVVMAQALEQYHQHFHEIFAAFYESPDQLRKLFAGANPRIARKQHSQVHEVHYYRTKQEYVQRLIKKIPQIAITNGLYYTTDRIAYFYHNPEAKDLSTLFHEATHQMMYETDPRDRGIAENRNFWITEGIACYMESYRQDKELVHFGDPNHIRIVAARYRYLNDEYYLPLKQFSDMGMQRFQTHRAISKNYSQASGLAHFFMHYKQGLYRDALIQHLAQIYSPRPVEIQSLAELTGVSFTELDRQYGEYIKSLGDQIEQTDPGAQ